MTVRDPLPTDLQEVIDLMADLLVLEGRQQVRGLDLRQKLKMKGLAPDESRNRIHALVPTYLRPLGDSRSDSYDLMPRAALHCKHSKRLLELTSSLRALVRAKYDEDPEFSQISWEEVSAYLERTGLESTELPVPTVTYSFFCLGVIGGIGGAWPRPLNDRLERILWSDDVEQILLQFDEELLPGRTSHGEDAGPPSPIPLSITNNFHGPVGAVATAPRAVAHGTIHVQAVDQALHQLVEQQDALGELTELLFPLLRRVRHGDPGSTEEPLLTAVAEAEEFKAFAKAVRAGIPEKSLEAAKQILGATAALRPLLQVLGG